MGLRYQKGNFYPFDFGPSRVRVGRQGETVSGCETLWQALSQEKRLPNIMMECGCLASLFVDIVTLERYEIPSRVRVGLRLCPDRQRLPGTIRRQSRRIAWQSSTMVAVSGDLKLYQYRQFENG